MQTINEHIKQNTFKPIYLIFGEEAYLKQQYKNKLKEALIGNSDDMNYSYFEGKGISIDQVIEISETLPFFHDRRVIIIENSGLFKKQNELSDYICKIPDTTHIILVESEMDKRSKLYKEIKKIGTISEMNILDERSLESWVLTLLKKDNKKITKETLTLFLSKVGTSMYNIKQELEKLVCYTIDKDVITTEDVDTISTVQITNKIFEMINAIAEKKQKKALDLYNDLLSLKEPPMRILYLITRQFNLMYQVKDLYRLRHNNQDIAKKTGLQSFIVNKYINQSKTFKTEFLREAIELCISTEEEVKTGKLTDKLGVEMVIVQCSRA